MIICEIISTVYKYFYYSILKNSEHDISEKMLNKKQLYELSDSDF